METGDLHANTRHKLALKSVKRGIKSARSAEKLGNKLANKGSNKGKKLAKKANRARWAAQLFLAQLFGFNSKSIDKFYDTVGFDTY